MPCCHAGKIGGLGKKKKRAQSKDTGHRQRHRINSTETRTPLTTNHHSLLPRAHTKPPCLPPSTHTNTHVQQHRK